MVKIGHLKPVFSSKANQKLYNSQGGPGILVRDPRWGDTHKGLKKEFYWSFEHAFPATRWHS